MSYEDKVLLKLRRIYRKDETVAALSKRLTEVETENGQLKSELAHLEHQINNTLNDREVNKKAKIEARKEELYRLKVDENSKLRKENIQLKKYRSELLNELLLIKEQIKTTKP